MIRRSLTLLMPKGRFSSMLDMGGVPLHDVKLDMTYGKNNKIQAIALDFNLITRSIEDARKQQQEEEMERKQSSEPIISSSTTTKKETMLNATSSENTSSSVPNTGLLEEMANALNVNLGGMMNNKKGASSKENDDDTSLFSSLTRGIMGDKQNITKTDHQTPNKTPVNHKAPPLIDVRTKYAKKLRQKLEGGVAGLELAKSEKASALKRGDAGGHFAARSHAMAMGVGSGNASSKWLSKTGTAELLQYVSDRSMKIALLPIPNQKNKNDDDAGIGSRMESLTEQLPQITFHALMKDGDQSADQIMEQVLETCDVSPICMLLVTDRDDYMKAAKDAGIYTCRVRPKSMRRGEITASYNIEGIEEVEQILNDINGVSFNSVFGNKGTNYS